MFNPEHFKTLGNEEKIKYLNDNPQEIIELDNVPYKDYIRFDYECDELIMAFANKKFRYNNICFLRSLCFGSQKSEMIIKVIDLYVQRGWFTNYDIIHDVFCRRYDYVTDYIVEVYDKLQIPININESNNNKDYQRSLCMSIIYGRDVLYTTAQCGPIANLIKLLKLYEERNLTIVDDILDVYVKDHYYEKCYEPEKILELIEICLKHGANLSNELVLNRLSTYCNDWTTIKYVINLSLEKGINICSNIYLINNIGSKFGIDANQFIIDHFVHHGTNIQGSYTDAIISKNNLSVLKYVLSRGIKPKNNIIELYVPCAQCHNGEGGACNYRKFTTNYICLDRYDISLNDLADLNKLDNVVDFGKFDTSWGYWVYFDKEADNNQVFDAPGIQYIDDDDSGLDNISINGNSYYQYRTQQVILPYDEIILDPLKFGIDGFY
jgi:hypothetical protein